jgi:RNA recognition motif-containing protein
MAFSVTEQDLRELFAPYGVVERININWLRVLLISLAS